MFCLPLSLPKSCYHSEDTYFCRNTANYLSGVIFFDGETLASFREGFASFCTYLTKLSDQCQSLLKVELRRKASRLPYRPRNGRTSTSSPRANSFELYRQHQESYHARGTLPRGCIHRREVVQRRGVRQLCLHVQRADPARRVAEHLS